METLNEWKNLTVQSLSAMGENIGGTLPKIVGALVIIIIGWLITKIILVVPGKLLKVSKVDRLTEKINEADLFGESDITVDVSKVILGFVKWLMYLVFLIVAADILNWTIISTEIGNLLRYLPKLFSAIALFMIGIYVATYIKKAVKGLFESFELSGSKIISTIVFYLITIFIGITALNQAGVDTTIITSNITLIVGAFLLALAIGFGLGSKEVISALLKAFYARKKYVAGDKIKLNDIEGVIESIDNICVTVKTNQGKVIVPIHEIVENRVIIKD
ncbi:mechanosensitive ion channel [Maribacter litopenaei]|uniref:Mechanosensitive ion channel n=1 Tax=Maribacter litopenaei TaxID=2976127 RepID=A0ABY5Y7B4_9FLAO|nr:mechanosensitive ion channel domain-containing protein [Maribacter litopenaei]UWX54134.1 mechanosensitive ion channel [Maribacter litopenaei]